jgi:DNA primase
LFLSDASILNNKVIAICEGAIDAMALASCGIASAAMTGTTPPDWFYRKMAFRKILIAADADEPGDKSAYKLKTELQLRGAKTFRLRPKGAKDWGEVLEKISAEAVQKKLLAFREDLTDEARAVEIINLFNANRKEAAEFATELIGEPNLRENLLYQMRYHHSIL